MNALCRANWRSGHINATLESFKMSRTDGPSAVCSITASLDTADDTDLFVAVISDKTTVVGDILTVIGDKVAVNGDR